MYLTWFYFQGKKKGKIVFSYSAVGLEHDLSASRGNE